MNLPHHAGAVKVSHDSGPFLRWAGGKRWLVPTVNALVASVPTNNYHEPFLGGGAIFFGYRSNKYSYLSDLNAGLIETYTQVRDNFEAVHSHLVKYENTEEQYYAVRKSIPDTPVERAARFIFLNHSSYNGIYRENLAGVYNVPYGFKKAPNYPTIGALRAASKKLAKTRLSMEDFEAALDRVKPGDFVFLDPPYTTAHNNNGFIKYNQKLFSFEDQVRLSRAVQKIRTRGAYYVLTNAAHSSISDLFGDTDARVELTRRNSVGGTNADRGTTSEYLFTNIASALTWSLG